MSILQLYVYKTCQILTEPPVSINGIYLVNIFTFMGLVLLISMELRFRNKMKSIEKINWNTTLFTFSQPIQFWNYAGWMLVASFVLPTIHSFLVASKYFLDNILLLSVGMTILGTTYLLDFIVEKYKLKYTK